MEEPDCPEGSVPDRGGERRTASLPLPAAFLEFLSENGLDPAVYSMAATIPRYIRELNLVFLNPRLKPGMESKIAEIEAELKCALDKVLWLPGFYAIPPEIQIAGSKAYQQGKIYGIDAASGAAILALDVRPGNHVLDLCAAPGAKLCMLADTLGTTGSLTGVDVAKHRLAACRTMLQKYSLGDRTRLFVADGTLFSLLPVNSRMQRMEGSIGVEENGSIFPEWTSRRSWKDRQKTRKANANGQQHLLAASEPELIYYGKHSGLVGQCKSDVFCPSVDDEACTSGYDKVLVDAECTHDGSIKHIQKFEFWGWKSLDRRVLDAERTENLLQLQVPLSFRQYLYFIQLGTSSKL
uniref:SAM-dependent MTase RsmB/NOP-type domain-containing protein n=1 Tax=Zea mays TaxID=4577 RepID=A0A804RCV3_MAIZE